MAPVLAGDVVAEPLMCHLVCNQKVAGTDVFKIGRGKRAVGQDCKCGVFHTVRTKVFYGYLVIFVPRKIKAYFFLKKVHNLGSIFEGIFRKFDIGWGCVKGKRDILMLSLNLVEFSRNQCDKIICVGLFLLPSDGLEACFFIDLFRDESAVR